MKESAWAETVFVDIGYTVIHEKNHHFNYFHFLMQNNYFHVLSSSSPSFVFFNGSLNLLWLLLNQCNSYILNPIITPSIKSFVSYMRLNCRLNVLFSYFNTAITFFCVVVAANEVTVPLLSFVVTSFQTKIFLILSL